MQKRPTISPPTLSTFVEREGKEDQGPATTEDNETDSIDLDPPSPGELPPGETLLVDFDASIIRRGRDGEDTQLLCLDVCPEKDHQGRSHHGRHNDLRSEAGKPG